MGLDFDLATVAGMAGLGGSAVAALGAAFFFRGLITRVIAQVLATTILSFVGFVGLFHMLGFQIVPPKEIAGVPVPHIPGMSSTFTAQSAPTDAAPAVPGGYTIKSPWSKQKDQ